MSIAPEVIEKARLLMQERTKINGAPAWGLTEVAIKKGDELATVYGVDASLVKVALYLAHIVFSKERGSEIMKNHDALSAREAEEKLLEWSVAGDLASKVRKAIELHHSPVDSGDLYCEVMKNAECFKFVTVEGIRIFVDSLMEERDMTLSEAQEYALYKMKQKQSYLTLDTVKVEAARHIVAVERMLHTPVN